MTKEQWINKVYELLCQAHAPESETEKSNLRESAETFASDECGYFNEGMTPQQALGEEMSRGS